MNLRKFTSSNERVNISFSRYYEGQLTHLAEADIEEVEDEKKLQITDAAEKVCHLILLEPVKWSIKSVMV